MGVGVLLSGTGTIFEAILDHGIDVSVAVADRPCRGLQIAEERGIPAVLLVREPYGFPEKTWDRGAYSDAVTDALRKHDVELVVVAGFGTVIPSTATAFERRMLNTHPALLPAFKGWHPVRDALAEGVKVTGWTAHIVTEEMDAGPIIEQEPVRVLPDDTEETLHERIKQVERSRYPAVIATYLEELRHQ